MLIYRTAAPFRGIKRHPLEVLCLGQQFLAYADHPDTCAPYAWPEEGLADLDITDLPEITTETAAAFLDEAYALLPEALRQRGLSAMSPAAEHLRSHSQVGTLPAIQAALEWLPNVELDYDSWMRIGMAVKGALGEAGARSVRGLVSAGCEGRTRHHGQGVDELQARSHRCRNNLSPRHGARLAA